MEKTKIHNDEKIKAIDVTKSFLEQDFQIEICQEQKFVPFQCIKVNDKDELYFLFKEIFELEKKGVQFFYRGQSNSDWLLESTLEREIRGKSLCIYNIEKSILSKFEQKLRGNLIDQSILNLSESIERERELWAIGRHYGLKTPLLDWSLSIYVALFMAYSEPKKDNERTDYSALFIIDGRYFILGDVKYVEPYLFTPRIDNYGRITAQKGYLTHYKIRDAIKDSLEKGKQCAFKIYIKNSLRKEILDYLKHIGIEYTTIYPDLLGVIKSVNNELEESLIENNSKSI